MKLLFGIVHHDDAAAASEALRTGDHRFTQVPSLGGFLGEANVTFILALEDERLPDVVATFEKACRTREVQVPLVLLERLSDWQAQTVAHGGATILVVDLAEMIRI